MEELYIPVLVLKSGSATDDLYFAGDKDELLCALEGYEFTSFYTKDKDGHRASEVVIRSDDIDVIELDTPDEAAEEIRKVKEDTAKVVDLTGLLDRLGKIEPTKSPAMSDVEDLDFEELIKHIDDGHWVNIKFRPVAKELYNVLIENFVNESVPGLFFALIGFTMDCADTTAFLLKASAYKSDEIVARQVVKAVHAWMNSLGMDERLILNTLMINKDKDYLVDAVFGAALEEMKSKAKD